MNNPSIPNISDHLLDFLDDYCNSHFLSEERVEFKEYAMKFLWGVSDSCEGLMSPFTQSSGHISSRQVFIPMIHLLHKLWIIEIDA